MEEHSRGVTRAVVGGRPADVALRLQSSAPEASTDEMDAW